MVRNAPKLGGASGPIRVEQRHPEDGRGLEGETEPDTGISALDLADGGPIRTDPIAELLQGPTTPAAREGDPRAEQARGLEGDGRVCPWA